MRYAWLALVAACSSAPPAPPAPPIREEWAEPAPAPEATDGVCAVRYQHDAVASLGACVARCEPGVCEALIARANEQALETCDDLCRGAWDAPADACEGAWDPLPAGTAARCEVNSVAGCPADRPYSWCVFPVPEQRCRCRPRTTPIE